MIVENTCRACQHHYNGHWHDDPNFNKPQCPKCGSFSIRREIDDNFDDKFDVEEKETEEKSQ